MTTGPAHADPAPDSLLDLQSLVAGIRWRRRTWTSLALIGLIVGALVAVLLQSHVATTRVLVVHEDETAGGGAGALMETDVALLETTTIAAAALERLGLPDRPDRFLRSYSGEGLTDNVLAIAVSAPTDADAVVRAEAVAAAFIADHLQRTEDAAGAEARALLDRRADAERDLAALDEQVDDVRAGGGDPAQTGAQLESLYSRRAALADQIQEFAQRASDADIGAPRVAAGTRVVDPARITSTRLPMSVAVNSLMGLVLGLGVGLAVAAVTTLVRDRPILRRDIAGHLGASVIVQLAAPPRGPARLLRRGRPAKERRQAAATLARLVRDAPAGVSLLEIGCPDTVAGLALGVVRELAPGVRVKILDELPGDHLRRAAARGAPAPIEDGPAAGPGRTLGVGSVGPGSSCTDLDRLGAETVLVVRAGRVGAAWLHTVARQLADQQVLVLGMVLVHPDPRDDTDGTLWDALHTALRGRPRPVAAPAPGPAAPRRATPLPAMADARPGTAVPAVPNPPVRPVRLDHSAVEVSS